MGLMSKLLLNFQGNLGYGADQIAKGITLDDLQAAIEEAIENYGGDTEVVVYQGNAQYGAKYGRIDTYDVFSPEDDEE